jgi:hypothetical protein
VRLRKKPAPSRRLCEGARLATGRRELPPNPRRSPLSPPPLLLRLPPHRRARRVLHLEPVRGSSRDNSAARRRGPRLSRSPGTFPAIRNLKPSGLRRSTPASLFQQRPGHSAHPGLRQTMTRTQSRLKPMAQARSRLEPHSRRRSRAYRVRLALDESALSPRELAVR